MTFDELLTEVYNLTSRPDLVAQTKAAVKAATLKAHMSDFYSKDIHETYVDLGNTDSYVHSFDYISLISNFRSIKYIRKYDTSSGEGGTFIQVVEPEEVLDSYGTAKTDICYVAGRVIEIKSSTEISKLILGCYVLPITVEATYSSWIAELYPWVIVFEAARVVFKTIGFDEESAAYERLVAEQFILLKASALSDVGY